jgi:hypothetical protein
MKRHFIVLVVGSLLFLVLFIRATIQIVLRSSAGPGAAADENTASLLGGLQLLGIYCVFAVLVLGHGLLRRPTTAVDSGAIDPSDRG